MRIVSREKGIGVCRRVGLILSVLCIALAAGASSAADDPVQRALKTFEKHRYEEGVRDLRAALPSLEQSKRSQAQLALGMLYLKDAELHRELHRSSAAVNADYLKRLAADRSRSRSRYSDLFLGLALIETGKADAATKPLEKFLAGIKDPTFGAIAACALGRAAYLGGSKEKAVERWKGINAESPEVKTELAAAWSAAGAGDKNAPAICDQSIAAAGRKGGPGVTALSNCLIVYARAGQVEKARDLLRSADLKAYSYRETMGRSKVLSFYDARLLDSLAEYYLAESVAALENAAQDTALRGIANYYLGEAHALAGDADLSLKATAVFLGAPQAPPQYKNRALVRQSEVQYRKGKRTEAIGAWDDLVRSNPSDPELLGDILLSCGRLAIECPHPAQAATVAAEKGEGRRFNAADIGLGRYYFGRKDYSRALTWLEAGRDKGNKNKIEFNDPVMLVDLAEAHYHSKKYSEALEIYFEMSKQFPQVRQIQEALQGIYSMEHKSAGDVKIN